MFLDFWVMLVLQFDRYYVIMEYLDSISINIDIYQLWTIEAMIFDQFYNEKKHFEH